MARSHWARWHDAYEDPSSSLSRRLAVVQARLRDALEGAPAGEVRLASMCAGQGRDVIPVVASHQRGRDVRALLVELDPDLVARARQSAEAVEHTRVEVLHGDASWTDAYRRIVPAQVVLVCGVFGNVSDGDVRTTISELPHLVAPGATVIWTRHRLPPDLTPAIRGWFVQAGFEEVAFDRSEDFSFGVGTARFTGDAQAFRPGRQMFRFVDDGGLARK